MVGGLGLAWGSESLGYDLYLSSGPRDKPHIRTVGRNSLRNLPEVSYMYHLMTIMIMTIMTVMTMLLR